MIRNVVHVTVAGTFASWYFLHPNAAPSNPTLKALKRACWNSLGSISLGSLIIAVLKALRQMVSRALVWCEAFAQRCADLWVWWVGGRRRWVAATATVLCAAASSVSCRVSKTWYTHILLPPFDLSVLTSHYLPLCILITPAVRFHRLRTSTWYAACHVEGRGEGHVIGDGSDDS